MFRQMFSVTVIEMLFLVGEFFVWFQLCQLKFFLHTCTQKNTILLLRKAATRLIFLPLKRNAKLTKIHNVFRNKLEMFTMILYMSNGDLLIYKLAKLLVKKNWNAVCIFPCTLTDLHSYSRRFSIRRAKAQNVLQHFGSFGSEMSGAKFEIYITTRRVTQQENRYLRFTAFAYAAWICEISAPTIQ